MSEKKLFKPNVVYVIEIHGCQYYVGCHCHKKEIYPSRILYKSGNFLRRAYNNHLITGQEYKDYCKLVHVEEYASKEEALNREAELIERLKEQYGGLCLNKAPGNKFGNTGVYHTEESKKKMSQALKGKDIQRLKKSVQQFTKDGQFIAEYSSIAEASRKTGTLPQNIGACCLGKRKSARNSIWKYV